jgi:hypothetical protein
MPGGRGGGGGSAWLSIRILRPQGGGGKAMAASAAWRLCRHRNGGGGNGSAAATGGFLVERIDLLAQPLDHVLHLPHLFRALAHPDIARIGLSTRSIDRHRLRS